MSAALSSCGVGVHLWRRTGLAQQAGSELSFAPSTEESGWKLTFLDCIEYERTFSSTCNVLKNAVCIYLPWTTFSAGKFISWLHMFDENGVTEKARAARRPWLSPPSGVPVILTSFLGEDRCYCLSHAWGQLSSFLLAAQRTSRVFKTKDPGRLELQGTCPLPAPLLKVQAAVGGPLELPGCGQVQEGPIPVRARAPPSLLARRPGS